MFFSIVFLLTKIINYDSYGSSFSAVTHDSKLYDCSEFACLQFLGTSLFPVKQRPASFLCSYFLLVTLGLFVLSAA